MGAYIAVFFIVSQLIAFGMFRVTPDLKTTLGGSLILIGGAVLLL